MENLTKAKKFGFMKPTEQRNFYITNKKTLYTQRRWRMNKSKDEILAFNSKLLNLEKEVKDGPYYPTNSSIETFLDLTSDLECYENDIVSEYDIIENKTFDSIIEISNFVGEIKNFEADYYMVDGYGNLEDITQDNLQSEIDYLKNWY